PSLSTLSPYTTLFRSKIAVGFFVLASIILVWTIVHWKGELFKDANIWKIYVFAVAYVLAIVVGFILMRSIKNENTHWQPFVFTLVLTVLGAVGLVGFLLPYIVQIGRASCR